MAFFSIVLVTYNRLDILKSTLNNIMSQSFSDFELLISNNGSSDGTKEYLDSISSPTVRVFHFEKNSRVRDIDKLVKLCKGNFIMPFLADDDTFASEAFSTIAKILTADPEIDIISFNCIKYNYDSKIATCCEAEHSGDTIFIDSYKQFKRDISHWGIGDAYDYTAPKLIHPSCAFYKSEVIFNTFKKQQQQLLIHPIIDVGLLGTLLHAKKNVHLNLPLAIVGQHQKQDSSDLFNRNNFLPFLSTIKISPLKGLSFANMSMESHLKMLKLNDIQYSWIRPRFYLYNIYSFLRCKPKDTKVFKDMAECIPGLCKSIIIYCLKEPHRPFVKIYKKITSRTQKKNFSTKTFNSITECAKWIRCKYITKH